MRLVTEWINVEYCQSSTVHKLKNLESEQSLKIHHNNYDLNTIMIVTIMIMI